MKKQKRCPRCKSPLILIIDEYGTMYVCGNGTCSYTEVSR